MADHQNAQANIHPLAIVEEGATLGAHVTIEPFAVVKRSVVLEDYVTIKSHAYIDGYTRIGEGTTIYPGAVIGTKTQDLKFRGERTYITIGKHCDIREYVTINGSCGEDTEVLIGDRCLLMAYSHVAHNCTVGNHVIMSNGATLAGHVDVEDYAIIGGLTPIHQFCRIGAHAMIGGMSRVPHDVPPYTIGGGVPYKLGGLNLVGLKRRGFSLETRTELAKAFKILYRSGLPLEDALERTRKELKPIPEILHWIAFCSKTKRGIIGREVTLANSSEEDRQETLQSGS